MAVLRLQCHQDRVRQATDQNPRIASLNLSDPLGPATSRGPDISPSRRIITSVELRVEVEAFQIDIQSQHPGYGPDQLLVQGP